MKYSVIIPTMWKAPDQLIPMFSKYNVCDLVGEILLIDNCGFDRSLVSLYDKVRILNDGTNLYVNPSWNLGVAQAKNHKIILANDDIYIKDVDSVMQEIDRFMCVGDLIGFDINCFRQKRIEELGVIRIEESPEQQFGFGVFMAFFRKTYIHIPKDLKIWYGDTWLRDYHKTYVIKGVDVETKMRTTSRTLNLKGQNKLEKKFYKQLQ